MNSKTSYKVIIALSFPLLLSSCGSNKSLFNVTKKYEDQQLTTSQNDSMYRDAKVSDSTNIADVAWKSIFTDPQLQSLIEAGLNNNYDLKNAVLQIAQAEASFKQSKLAMLPNLNFAPQISHNKSSQNALNFPAGININLKTTTVQLGFNTNWEIDIWGKLASARRGAAASWFQTEASRRAVQTSIIANVANMYYTLLALDKQLAITMETIEIRNKTIKTLNALKEAAIVNGAAVVQAEANLYAAEVSLPDLKQSIRELENAMSVLIGQPAQSILRGKLENSVVTTNLAVGVPIQLLHNRPDVLSAELALRKAFENTNYAKAQFYPSLTLTSGTAGISALTTKTLFAPESFFYSLVGGLTQPIFNRGVLKANHKIALAQQEQAFNTFQKTLLTASQEVSNALYAYDAGKEKQVARAKQIASLEKAVSFNMQLLEYSSATNYTDVLTSEQTLLTAKLSAINDSLQQYKAMIELYRALGGGWK